MRYEFTVPMSHESIASLAYYYWEREGCRPDDLPVPYPLRMESGAETWSKWYWWVAELDLRAWESHKKAMVEAEPSTTNPYFEEKIESIESSSTVEPTVAPDDEMDSKFPRSEKLEQWRSTQERLLDVNNFVPRKEILERYGKKDGAVANYVGISKGGSTTTTTTGSR